MLQNLQAGDLEKSIDQGGKGRTLKISKAVNGKFIFLKPKLPDGTEGRNYQVIQKNPGISKWMPAIFGEISINGKAFLVFENIRKDGQGDELAQVADIKLAGKTSELNNAIASNREMKVTRGRHKTWHNKLWMKITTLLAPNFLLTNGGVRLIDYIRSKKILQSSLKKTSPQSIQKLLKDLTQMKVDLKKSNFALIGASIALIKEKDGSIRAVLIDPAHMQCSKDLRSKAAKQIGEEQAKKVFFQDPVSSGKDEYELYKRSNEISLDAIIASVKGVLRKHP